MSAPTPEEQLQFLANLQRLLDEGDFVATYKFALLLALADLSVTHGDDLGSPLPLSTEQIAERFLDYYWRQATPYVPLARAGDATILQQNTGRQAKAISLVAEARAAYTAGGSPAALPARERRGLVRELARTIEVMPLWKLQRMGDGVIPFLYENVERGHAIVLRPGVATCFRRFHGLVRNVVQAAWVRFVRNLRRNAPLLGEASDLGAFLFGAERTALEIYVPLLRDLQSGKCFYCRAPLRDRGEVDHFIPWSRYPSDLAHNFVLAHGPCNHSKRDFLAALPHLERWRRRNDDVGRALAAYCTERALPNDADGSIRIARWAYEQADRTDAHVWLERKQFVPLDPGWRAVV